MTLPLAVIERTPFREYLELYENDVVRALKKLNSDALELYYELESLRKDFKDIESKDDKRHNKHLDRTIRDKEERLSRLIKFNDYPSMIMAAYPNSKFITSHDYKRAKDSILDPILIRGISSGTFAKHAKQHGRDFYFVETGYLGNYPCENNKTGRKVYHRIEKNSMQQSRILDVPDDRWKKLCEFNPSLEYKGWKNKGSKILLIMSTEKPFEFYGDNKNQWLEKTLDTLRSYSDREILIREKASRSERTSDTIYNSFDSDDIYAVVTYNSIAAVEAIQYGIPAFCTVPTAASSITTSDLTQIETPPKLDEDIIYKWLSSIAYGQFSLDEMLTGKAWELVKENEKRPTFNY